MHPMKMREQRPAGMFDVFGPESALEFECAAHDLVGSQPAGDAGRHNAGQFLWGFLRHEVADIRQLGDGDPRVRRAEPFYISGAER
nr:hypothetical protein [Nocardia sp. XZ_19_231]